MEFRWLTDDEVVEFVNPVCVQRGWALLNVNPAFPTCLVKGAFEGPRLLGFLVLQLFPVIGPAYVEPGLRDGTISRALADQIHDYLVERQARAALTLCESPLTERLAERHGMKKVLEPVYLWLSEGGSDGGLRRDRG